MTDLRSTIPALIARRQAVGASSPEGRRISILIEQIQDRMAPADMIARTIQEIEQVRRDGGEYIHANHGAK